MIAGEHDAVGLWAASERRRRIVSLVVLGLLAGASAGLAMASVAGARRSDDAYERLRQETQASDAVVFASQVGLAQPDWTDVAALPYVTDAGAFGIGFGAETDEGLFLPAWGPWLDTVDRPRVVDGRLPDPDDPDEVVLARGRDGSERLAVGDRIDLSLLTFDATTFAPVEPYEATVEVVGITSSPFELSALPGDGALFAGPGFEGVVADLQAEGRLIGFSNLMVRLEDPARDMPRLREDSRRLLAEQYPDVPLEELPVLDLTDSAKRVTNGTDLERDGLLLFGAAVAAAGLLLVAQALSRSVRAASGDLPTLTGMGMSLHDVERGLVRAHRTAVVVAVVASVAIAIGLSTAFPIGLSRRVDPDVGWHLDLPIVLGGALITVAVLALGLRLSARSAVRAEGTVVAGGRRVAPPIGRSPLPVPMAVGAGLALDPGRGARALPTRPALIGAVLGVAGVVGALTLAVGIGDATRPERFGTTWHGEALININDPAELDAALAEFEALRDRAVADPDVDAVATMMRGHLHVDGTSLPAYSIAVDDGVLDYTVMDGRRPDRPGEIALGPSTARDLGVGIGDDLTIGQGDLAREAEVVGTALLVQTPHSSFDQGVWVTEADLIDVGGLAPLESETAPSPLLAFRFADPDRADELVASYADSPSGLLAVEPAAVPPDGANLANVRVLPFLFAGFTALLAAGVVGHVAASTVRRRRHDLAVLRALGFTPRQIWMALLAQASTLAVIGIVVGTPIGLAAGRLAWRAVTDAVPMIYVAPTSLVAIVLVPPVALVVANLLAAGPAQLAARAPTASVLRSE